MSVRMPSWLSGDHIVVGIGLPVVTFERHEKLSERMHIYGCNRVSW